MGDVIPFKKPEPKDEQVAVMVEITVLEDGEVLLWVDGEMKSSEDFVWAIEAVGHAVASLEELTNG